MYQHFEYCLIMGDILPLLLPLITELVVLTDINECASDPCQNNGSCTDMVNAYECSCEAGYNGTHCENGNSSHPFFYDSVIDLKALVFFLRLTINRLRRNKYTIPIIFNDTES